MTYLDEIFSKGREEHIFTGTRQEVVEYIETHPEVRERGKYFVYKGGTENRVGVSVMVYMAFAKSTVTINRGGGNR